QNCAYNLQPINGVHGFSSSNGPSVKLRESNHGSQYKNYRKKSERSFSELSGQVRGMSIETGTAVPVNWPSPVRRRVPVRQHDGARTGFCRKRYTAMSLEPRTKRRSRGLAEHP